MKLSQGLVNFDTNGRIVLTFYFLFINQNLNLLTTKISMNQVTENLKNRMIDTLIQSQKGTLNKFLLNNKKLNTKYGKMFLK